MKCPNTACQGGFVPGAPRVLDGRTYSTIDKCPDCEMRAAERTSKPAFRRPKIEKPADNTRPRFQDLQAAAGAWIKSHGKAAERILSYAKAIASIGMKVRVKHLVERVREDGVKEHWDLEEYQINNSHTAYIARWLIAQAPELDGTIEFRTARWGDDQEPA